MFKPLIEDLLESGMTETAIALRVGASQASINRIKRTNQNPKYELGVALVELHREVTQAAMTPATNLKNENRA